MGHYNLVEHGLLGTAAAGGFIQQYGSQRGTVHNSLQKG